MEEGLRDLKTALSGLFTEFNEQEKNFERTSREIERDNTKRLRQLDLAERDKEKTNEKKKEELEQRKKEGEIKAQEKAEANEKKIEQMMAKLEEDKEKDFKTLETRKDRPEKAKALVEAAQQEQVVFEERFLEERKEWDKKTLPKLQEVKAVRARPWLEAHLVFKL